MINKNIFLCNQYTGLDFTAISSKSQPRPGKGPLVLDTPVTTRYFEDENGIIQSYTSSEHPLAYSDGTLLGYPREPEKTNFLYDSASPATQTRSLDAGDYICSVKEGDGSVTLSGDASGTVSLDSPVQFTLAVAGSVTFTVSGTVDKFQCEDGTIETSFIATPVDSSATRPSEMTGDYTYLPEVNHRQSEGTVIVKCVLGFDQDIIDASLVLYGLQSTDRGIYLSSGDKDFHLHDGTNVSALQPGFRNYTPGSVFNLVGRWGGGTQNVSSDIGGTLRFGVDLSYNGTFPTDGSGRIYLFSGEMPGPVYIQRVASYRTKLSESAIREVINSWA